jgi:hypothetical protein
MKKRGEGEKERDKNRLCDLESFCEIFSHNSYLQTIAIGLFIFELGRFTVCIV